MHMSNVFLEGNEAVAWAALRAGCRFFAGYPITPATSIYSTMLKILPPEGGIVLQAEDEIAAIGYCIGASMAGLKVMTATSGPGLSLFSENISFAIGSEIPLVIVDVQRLGPSTGSATRGADGDIQFMRWGNSGGLPVIVLAPVDARDCYVLTVHAFNLAERYRCPVFLASNKEIGLTRESVDMGAVELPPIEERRRPAPGEPFLPFEVSAGAGVPAFLPIGGTVPVRQTSSTHGKDGYITTDPEEIKGVITRLKSKIESQADRLAMLEYCEAPDADTLLVTYGVTARSAKAVFKARRESGRPVSLLILKTLWPVAERHLQDVAAKYRRILVIEMNMGQYVREMARALPGSEIAFLGQMDGRLITPGRIEEALNG